MSQLFKNFVSMQLASDMGATDTSFTVLAGQGAQCPTIGTTDENYFLVMFTDKSGNKELVKVIEHVAGTDVFAVGSSTAVAHSASVSGRAQEGTTALAIVASEAHSIKLPWSAATAEAITPLAGLTASVAEINKLDGMTASKAELNILTGVTATSAELNAACDGGTGLTGETSANSTTASTSITFGSVTSGDRLLVAVHGTVTGSSVATGGFSILGADTGCTAGVRFAGDNSTDQYIGYVQAIIAASNMLRYDALFFIHVSSSGTLNLKNVITIEGLTGPTYHNAISGFFLKKA